MKHQRQYLYTHSPTPLCVYRGCSLSIAGPRASPPAFVQPLTKSRRSCLQISLTPALSALSSDITQPPAGIDSLLFTPASPFLEGFQDLLLPSGEKFRFFSFRLCNLTATGQATLAVSCSEFSCISHFTMFYHILFFLSDTSLTYIHVSGGQEYVSTCPKLTLL